jgi:hypothetical protein
MERTNKPKDFYQFVKKMKTHILEYIASSDSQTLIKKKTYRTDPIFLEKILHEEMNEYDFEITKDCLLHDNVPEDELEGTFINLCLERFKVDITRLEMCTEYELISYNRILNGILTIGKGSKFGKLFKKLGYQVIMTCLYTDHFVDIDLTFLKYFDSPKITPIQIPIIYHYLIKVIYTSKPIMFAMYILVKNSLDRELTKEELGDLMTYIATEKILKNLNSAMLGGKQAVTSYFAQIFISDNFMNDINIDNSKEEEELKKVMKGSNSFKEGIL